jgi:hypothetical protein
MGIEPIRKAVPALENKQFGAMPNAKCDGRVNYPVNLRQRRITGQTAQRSRTPRRAKRLFSANARLMPAFSVDKIRITDLIAAYHHYVQPEGLPWLCARP